MACWLSLLSCRCDRPPAETPVDEFVATLERVDFDTEAQVETVVANAASSTRAIVFVHVDWALMAMQQKLFAEFFLDYQRRFPDDPVQFHYVDCTPVDHSYAPLKALAGWREIEESKGMSLIHGWGELVWMKQGRVVHVEQIINFNSAEQLTKKTEALLIR